MCELMAISSNRRVDPQFSFKEIKRRGGKTGTHTHGWGIAFYHGKKAVIYKEAEPAYNSRLAGKIARQELRTESRIFIAHVRKASSGKPSLENTHPFKRTLFGKEWAFAHNGTVGKYKKKDGIFRKDIGTFRTEGETDSERAFLYILSRIKRQCTKHSSPEEFAAVIAESARLLSSLGRFNFIMSDSQYIFCFGANSLYFTQRSMKRKNHAQYENLEDKDYVIAVPSVIHEKAVILATYPLTEHEKWTRIRGFKVFAQGKEIDF